MSFTGRRKYVNVYAGAYQLRDQLIIAEFKPSYAGRYVCTIYLVNGHSKVAYTTLLTSPDERPGKS